MKNKKRIAELERQVKELLEAIAKINEQAIYYYPIKVDHPPDSITKVTC